MVGARADAFSHNSIKCLNLWCNAVLGFFPTGSVLGLRTVLFAGLPFLPVLPRMAACLQDRCSPGFQPESPVFRITKGAHRHLRKPAAMRVIVE